MYVRPEHFLPVLAELDRRDTPVCRYLRRELVKRSTWNGNTYQCDDDALTLECAEAFRGAGYNVSHSHAGNVLADALRAAVTLPPVPHGWASV